MDAMMHRIEWTTLLFFAAMFVTMECLERLGLITWIGEQTKRVILSVDNEDAQLAVAIIIILWVWSMKNKRECAHQSIHIILIISGICIDLIIGR